MRAFESSPVHCLNPLPIGNRRKPAKWEARAMLQITWVICRNNSHKMYRLSISSSILFALFSLCRAWMYSFTQVTTWSLNAPLISWCKMSGESSSWMSALGKSLVKGCEVYVSEFNNAKKNKNTTITSPTSPYSSHKTPSSNSWTSISVCSRERRPHFSSSRAFALAVHLSQNRDT